jgi:hypothetical protein
MSRTQILACSSRHTIGRVPFSPPAREGHDQETKIEPANKDAKYLIGVKGGKRSAS